MVHNQQEPAQPAADVPQQHATAPQQHIAVGGDVYGATIGEMKGGTINVYPPAPEPPAALPGGAATAPAPAPVAPPPARGWRVSIAASGVFLVLWLVLAVSLPERTPTGHTLATTTAPHGATGATGTPPTAPPTGALSAVVASIGHRLTTSTHTATQPNVSPATAGGTAAVSSPPTPIPLAAPAQPAAPYTLNSDGDDDFGGDDNFGDDDRDD